MNNFRELKVWQKSIDFVVAVYKATDALPKAEKYNLISQMQSCAVSIPSNISEGTGRNSTPAFKHFLTISIGSAHELETQIIVCQRLGYLSDTNYNELMKGITEIQKMLYALHNSL